MIGTLIGAGIGAVGSAISAIASKNAAARSNAALRREIDYNQAWYDRRYNEDATQRADAQRVLNMAMERIKADNKAAMGTDAVMGTNLQDRVKEQSARTIGNIMADTAAKGAADKAETERQYQANRRAFAGQQMANAQATAQAIGQAGQGVAQAAVGAGQAYDEMKQQGEYNNKLMELLINSGKKGS
jgi:hypothetical protein